MWLLSHEKCSASDQKSASRFVLRPGCEYSVGRIDCDVTIREEMSVSRKHAVISAKSEQNSDNKHTVCLTDSSTYGTFVNERSVHKETCELEEGDTIVFGTRREVTGFYSLVWQPMVFCCSQVGLSLPAIKASLIGFRIPVLDAWSEAVTHLVIPEILATKKVLCAVARGVPIVRVSWIHSLIHSIENFSPMPDPAEHLPAIASSCQMHDAANFRVDGRRASLFERCRFYFLDSYEHQQLSLPISYCKGTCTLIDVSDVTFATFDRYASADSIVVSGDTGRLCSAPGGTEFVSKLELTLEAAGRSKVRDSKIIHALIQVSLSEILPLSSRPLDDGVLAPDSQISSHFYTPLDSTGKTAVPALSSIPLSFSANLSQRNESQGTQKKGSQDRKSFMLSIFDEENLDQSDCTSQTSSSNIAYQLPSNKEGSPPSHAPRPLLVDRPDNNINSSPVATIASQGDVVVKNELASPTQGDLSPPRPCAANESQKPEGWISTPYCSTGEKVNGTQRQPDPTVARDRSTLGSKRFVKHRWAGIDQHYFLKPFIRVGANSEVRQPCSDEQSVASPIVKTERASLSPPPNPRSLAKSQTPTTPKSKRVSSGRSPGAKRSHLFELCDTDSDDESNIRF